MDQLQIDTRLRMMYPNVIPGQKFNFCGKQFTYKGMDMLYDQMDAMSRGEFADIYHVGNASLMMNDPLGYTLPQFQLDSALTAALTGNVDGFLAGAAGALMYNQIANISDPFCGKKYTTDEAIRGAIKGALVAGAANALGNIASGFVPPGLDGPVQAVKGVIGGVTKQLPFKAAGAADIVNQIVAVKTLLNVAVKGPTALIFKAVGSNFGLPAMAGLASAAASTVNLQSETAALAKLASNPIAFAAKAAQMQRQFPLVNMNKLASKMLTGAIAGALGGKGFNIASMVPNMALAGGLMKMLPLPGKTPVFDAINPIKTAQPPKPKKPVEMKNLFAEGAAGAAMATMKQPLSQFMGMKATIAPQTNMVADTAAKTSYGNKLVGNANTVNWGSGGYGRNTRYENLEKKRMELSAKVEKHTAELLASVDYSKLTKYSYPDLIKKHPRIKPTSTVIEALAIIEEDEAKANTAISTA
jgi:hypothetical protein